MLAQIGVKDMKEPRLRVVAMPSDTNPAGNIFGGWIMSQMDLAASVAARELAPEGVATVSMDKVVFKQPVFVADVLSCYAKIMGVGNSSIKVDVEVISDRISKEGFAMCVPVCSASLTFVALDKNGEKKLIDDDLKKIHGF